jgi:hypothetical protein
VLDAKTGTQHRVLRAPLPLFAFDDFGQSLAASGNLALVGAPIVDGRGAAYLMSISNGAVVRRLQDYLRSMAPMQVAKLRSTLIVGGYSSGAHTPEVWNLVFDSSDGVSASQIWSPTEYGMCWEGAGECLHRLMNDDFTMDGSNDASSPTLVTPGMPIHDAVALTRFLMEATIGYVRFRVDLQPKTVGGPIDMAVITRHEGFRWVQRKKLTGANFSKS